MFAKHIDYKDENEFRIISLTEEEYDYIDISESIIAIMIIPIYLETSQVASLYNFSNEKGVPLLYLTVNDDCNISIANKYTSTSTIDGCFNLNCEVLKRETIMTYKKVRKYQNLDFFAIDVPVRINTKNMF